MEGLDLIRMAYLEHRTNYCKCFNYKQLCPICKKYFYRKKGRDGLHSRKCPVCVRKYHGCGLTVDEWIIKDDDVNPRDFCKLENLTDL